VLSPRDCPFASRCVQLPDGFVTASAALRIARCSWSKWSTPPSTAVASTAVASHEPPGSGCTRCCDFLAFGFMVSTALSSNSSYKEASHIPNCAAPLRTHSRGVMQIQPSLEISLSFHFETHIPPIARDPKRHRDLRSFPHLQARLPPSHIGTTSGCSRPPCLA